MSDKKEFHYFVLSEYEEEEKYLCDMAKKGYLFEKVTMPGIYHFKKGNPVNMIYRIDFNPQKKENFESYLQMFRDYGWEYIQDLNEFSYFCKEDDGADDDIFSDNESRIEMLERIVHRKMWPLIVLFLCLLNPLGMRIYLSGDFTDPIVVTFCILWVVAILIYVVAILRSVLGFARLRKKWKK